MGDATVASVSDARSNANDQLAHAAKTVGGSKSRRAVFDAIMRGKKEVKTISYVMDATGLPRKRALTEAKRLVNNHLVTQVQLNSETAYKKDAFLAQHRSRILELAGDPRKLARLPTKVNRSAGSTTRIVVRSAAVRATRITVDDISSFSAVRKVAHNLPDVVIPEAAFKAGLVSVLGDLNQQKDWGGESADVITSRLTINGKRVGAVLVLKGPGKRRKRLVPGDLGKNGDQIHRMFTASGDVFLVQYWSQIDDAVVRELATFAQLKSVLENRRIYFGVIDGSDSARLIAAYPAAFRQT
jgi:hypothetical protein